MRRFIELKTQPTKDNLSVIARKILNETVLSINGKLYRFVEIEAYLHNTDHPDPYVHQNNDQATYGSWYFHRAKTNYKGGTFKGLDLTLGDSTSNTYCGFLIRSISNTKGELIEGPCNVVDEILASYEKSSIKEFTNDKLLSVMENEHKFVIQDLAVSSKMPLYCGPRIGLGNTDATYQAASYRYATINKKLKKCTTLKAF